MDSSSQSVAVFLGGLQTVMEQMRTVVWNHYARCGVHPKNPTLTLSGRPFTVYSDGVPRELQGAIDMGITVVGADNLDYELVVEVCWDEQGWIISICAWVEAETGGSTLLRELPERSTSELQRCLELLKTSAANLLSFEDLIPGPHPISA